MLTKAKYGFLFEDSQVKLWFRNFVFHRHFKPKS